jgi:hypothetical protein
MRSAQICVKSDLYKDQGIIVSSSSILWFYYYLEVRLKLILDLFSGFMSLIGIKFLPWLSLLSSNELQALLEDCILYLP